MGLLRVGGMQAEREVDYSNVRSGTGDGGVPHGEVLMEFVDAAMQLDPEQTGPTREALGEAIGEAGVVDAAAVTAMFQLNTRAADAIGMPIDEGSVEGRSKMGEELGFEPRNDGIAP